MKNEEEKRKDNKDVEIDTNRLQKGKAHIGLGEWGHTFSDKTDKKYSTIYT
jgi:hypothetical protein